MKSESAKHKAGTKKTADGTDVRSYKFVPVREHSS